MHKQWLNTTYVIGAESEFVKGEAQTAAKVVVVPPPSASDAAAPKQAVAVVDTTQPPNEAAPHASGSTVEITADTQAD